jgi:hypothetical protein
MRSSPCAEELSWKGSVTRCSTKARAVARSWLVGLLTSIYFSRPTSPRRRKSPLLYSVHRSTSRWTEVQIQLKAASRQWRGKTRFEASWRHLHGPVLTLRDEHAERLGLRTGNDCIEMRFESEEGWFPFQRVTDADAQLVERTAAYIRSWVFSDDSGLQRHATESIAAVALRSRDSRRQLSG